MPRFSSPPSSQGSSGQLSDDRRSESDSSGGSSMEPNGDQSDEVSSDSGISVVENSPLPAFIKTDLPAEESAQSSQESDEPRDGPKAAAAAHHQGIKCRRGRPRKAATGNEPGTTIESDDIQKGGISGRRSGRVLAQALSRKAKAPVQDETGKSQKRVTRMKPSQKKPSQPEPTQATQRKGRKLSKGGKESATGPDEEWEVEAIVGVRADATFEQLYHVKWKGFSSNENTWEPKENLGKCQRAIRDFESKRELPAKKRKYTAK